MDTSGTIEDDSDEFVPDDGFWGEFEYGVDSKCRVVIPPEFRPKLGTEFVIVRWPEPSIGLFPVKVWAKVASKLKGPVMQREQAFLRQMIAGSRLLVKLDAQYRLALPKNLRDWSEVGPSQTAVIVGQYSHLEIWNKTKWDERTKGLTFEKMFNAADAVGLSEVLTGQ